MLTCPRDGSGLLWQNTDRGPLDRCAQCAGMWVPSVVVARHGGTMPRDAQLRERGTPTQLQCPSDGSVLVAIHHHGIEVDACTKCNGVWLDAGELDRLRAAHASANGQDSRDQGRTASDVLGGIEGRAEVSDLASETTSSVFDFLGDLFSGF